MKKSDDPFARAVSADDLSRQGQIDRDRAERFGILDEMRAAFADTSTEEIEREAARALAEVREEMRARVSPKDRDLSLPEG